MIANEIQSSLRERFNPDGSDLRRYQMRLLEILLYIDSVCRKHGINYWLSSGTCLGAVRHGGFIPWDDDIDVEMLDQDYRRFIKVMKEEQDGRFILQSKENDPAYLPTHVKIRDTRSIVTEDNNMDRHYRYKGCFVDIFHIAPSNSLFLYRVGAFIHGRYVKAVTADLDNGRKSIRGLLWSGLHAVSLPLLKAFTALGNPATLRHSMGYFCKKIRLRKDLLPLKEMMFEGHPFPAPNDTDSYLRLIYGDYMALPSIDRIRVHLARFELLDE